ncbi:MAG: translocation/assembly module TamB domain-containing protein, partial [bacterium]|nr:translocation/assembly module TamB domain-containing protein [bacterium]
MKKTVIIVLTSVVALFLGLNLYLFKLGGMEKIVNDQLTKYLESKYNLTVSIREMGGNLYDGMTLHDVNLYYDDSVSFYSILHIPKMSAGYSLRNLWNKDYLFSFLQLDSAEITLRRDSLGRWIIPEFGKQDTTRSARPSFGVDELQLNNLRIRLIDPDDELSIEGLWLSLAVSGSGDNISINVEQFEFQMSDDRYRLDAARGKLTYDNRFLLFQDIYMTAGETRFRFDGNLSFADELSGMVEFDIDNANLDELTKMTKPHLRGLLDLYGYVKIEDKAISGRTTLAGSLFMMEFENLVTDFRFEEKHLYLDTIHGAALGNCSIDGSGQLDFSVSPQEYDLTAEISNFNLKSLVKNSFESSLTGQVRMTGRSFKKETLLLDFDVDLFESSFDEYPLQEVSGSLVITQDSVTFLDPFRVAYFENLFTTSGRVEYQGNMELDIAAELNNLDRYRGKLFIDQPGGRGQATVRMTGKTSDPDLSGHFESDSLYLYGFFSNDFKADFAIENFLNGRLGWVDATFGSGQAWALPFDSGYVWTRVDSSVVIVDRADIGNQNWRLTGDGLFDYGSERMHMSHENVRLTLFDRDFTNVSRIDFDIDSSGFDFQRLELSAGETSLNLKGRLNFDETMSLGLGLREVESGPWIKLLNDSLAVGGVVSCDAELGGSFLSPQIKLRGQVDELTYRDLVLGDLYTNLYYREELLQVDSLVIYAPTSQNEPQAPKVDSSGRRPGERMLGNLNRARPTVGRYHGRGFLPIDLTFSTSNIDRIPNEQFDLTITAADNRFDLVSLLLPSVEELSGDFSSHFRLSGTPNDPLLQGYAELKNGRLKYFDLEHPIYVDSAGATMVNNKIVIDGIEAYSTPNKERDGTRRYMYLEGELIVTALDSLYYDLDVTLPKEFPFSYELDDITGKVEGELQVVGQTPPLVTGDLTLMSTRYLVNFAQPEEGSPIMMALEGENSWDLDVNIDILSNYWIKNEDIDAEFSGEMELIRESGNYRFIGEMEIIRGKGFLFDKTFRLEPGGQVIFEGKEQFNPRLDIVGYTRILTNLPSQFEENPTSEHLEVGVHISGTLDTVVINPVEG